MVDLSGSKGFMFNMDTLRFLEIFQSRLCHHFPTLGKRMWLASVSRAALRSNRTRTDISLLSPAVRRREDKRRSLVIVTSADWTMMSAKSWLKVLNKLIVLGCTAFVSLSLFSQCSLFFFLADPVPCPDPVDHTPVSHLFIYLCCIWTRSSLPCVASSSSLLLWLLSGSVSL